jgi:hypothetical protein
MTLPQDGADYTPAEEVKQRNRLDPNGPHMVAEF